MQGAFARRAIVVACFAVLAACAKEPNLLNIKRGDGPDEFAILPTRPLEAPPSYQDLPAPTPGGTNLTDPDPIGDAVAALGGRRDRLAPGNIATGEQALVSHALRYGAAGNIRQTLATEDLEFRRRHNGKLLERLFNVNVYFRAYKPMSLDQHAELLRLRRKGVWTPSAPPDPNRRRRR